MSEVLDALAALSKLLDESVVIKTGQDLRVQQGWEEVKKHPEDRAEFFRKARNQNYLQATRTDLAAVSIYEDAVNARIVTDKRIGMETPNASDS